MRAWLLRGLAAWARLKAALRERERRREEHLPHGICSTCGEVQPLAGGTCLDCDVKTI